MQHASTSASDSSEHSVLLSTDSSGHVMVKVVVSPSMDFVACVSFPFSRP